MKDKIQLFILVVGLILLLFVGVQMASASYTYERTPSGTTPYSPISFEITADDIITDLELDASTTYWGIKIDYGDGFDDYPTCSTSTGNAVFTECVPVETLSKTFEVGFCIGFMTETIVAIGDTSEGLCEGGDPNFDGVEFEQDYSPPYVFTIGDYYGNILTLTSQSVASTTAYIGDLINSVSPFLWLIIGLPLGFWIINETIKLITPKKVKIKK